MHWPFMFKMTFIQFSSQSIIWRRIDCSHPQVLCQLRSNLLFLRVWHQTPLRCELKETHILRQWLNVEEITRQAVTCHPSLCPYIHPFFLSSSIRPSIITPSIHSSSIPLSIHQSIPPSIWPSVCQSVYPFLSVRPPVHHSIHPYIRLQVNVLSMQGDVNRTSMYFKKNIFMSLPFTFKAILTKWQVIDCGLARHAFLGQSSAKAVHIMTPNGCFQTFFAPPINHIFLINTASLIMLKWDRTYI